MAVSRSKIDQIYEEGFWDGDNIAVSPDGIFSFNEIRSCADIFRMHKTGILDIQPDFQRDVVWKGADQTRLIDSIIKELPIPSLCFGYDSKKQKWLVIDGLQRIYTIVKFLGDDDWRLSKLDDIDERISGVKVSDLRQDPKCADIITRVENYSLPITVLRCDYSKNEHLAFLFTIFHRLNSNGVKLSNQEIRNCIYAGTLNGLLRELDDSSSWCCINGKKKGEGNRMQTQELILRFFAYYYNLSEYNGRQTLFLNQFMSQHRAIDTDIIEEWKQLFLDTSNVLWNLLKGKVIERKRLSKVIQDALMYAIAKNLNEFRQLDIEQQAEKVAKVLSSKVLSESNLSGGIAQKTKLIERLNYVAENLMR